MSFQSKLKGLSHIQSLSKLISDGQSFVGNIKQWVGYNHIFKGDVAIQGSLFADRLYFGALYPNIIYRISSCDTTTYWARVDSNAGMAIALEPSSGETDTIPTQEGKSIRLTFSTATDTDPSKPMVFYMFQNAIDLSFLDYIGFFYKGKASTDYYADALKLVLLTDFGDFDAVALTYDNICDSYNVFASDWSEGSTPTWKYREIALSSRTRNSRKRVVGVGFYNDRTSANFYENNETLDITKIDCYKLGTNYGPVRGPVIAVPLAPNEYVDAGELVELNANGHAKSAGGATTNFFGQVVRHQLMGPGGIRHGHTHGIENYVLVQYGGTINFPVQSASAGYDADSVVSVYNSNAASKITSKGGIIGKVQRQVISEGGVVPIKIDPTYVQNDDFHIYAPDTTNPTANPDPANGYMYYNTSSGHLMIYDSDVNDFVSVDNYVVVVGTGTGATGYFTSVTKAHDGTYDSPIPPNAVLMEAILNRGNTTSLSIKIMDGSNTYTWSVGTSQYKYTQKINERFSNSITVKVDTGTVDDAFMILIFKYLT